MAKQTLAEFLNYMAESPRTFGWDAVLVYDRATANKMLMQEYIARFNSESSFEPITEMVVTTPGVRWEYLYDTVLDKPWLSFNNAEDGGSRADLSMRIVGGKQVSVNSNDGRPRRVTRIKMNDGINGSTLHAFVTLTSSNATVNESGVVQLDLSKGVSFYLTFADTMEEDVQGGVKYKAIFDRWPDSKKKFVINRMSMSGDDFLKPEKFWLTTYKTLSRADEAPGDGEIAVYISTVGREEGTAPKAHPLLYQATPQPTMNLILNGRLMMDHLFVEWFRGLHAENESRPFKYDLIGGGGVGEHVTGIQATQGVLQMDAVVIEHPPEDKLDSFFEYGFKLPFANDEVWGEGEFFLQLKDNKLQLVWRGRNNAWLSVSVNGQGRVGGETDFTWNAVVYYELVVSDRESSYGMLELRRLPGGIVSPVLSLRLSDWDTGEIEHKEVWRQRDKIENPSREILANAINAALDSLAENFAKVDAFRLNGLLFEGGRSLLQPLSNYFPGDLTLPGFLSPGKEGFFIEPLEAKVKVGSSFKFEVPPGKKVTWSVNNLPGESGDPGRIDPTGMYTPPASSELSISLHKRVIVSATDGNITSKAMVSVVRRTVGLDPLAMAVSQTQGIENKYKVTAASIDGHALTWSLSPGAVGSLEDDPGGDPAVQDTKLYVLPPKTRDDTVFDEARGVHVSAVSEAWQKYRATPQWQPADDLSEILALDVIIVSDGSVADQINILIPRVNEGNWMDVKADGASVQLTFWREVRGSDEPEIVPKEETAWHLLVGDGALDDNGRYTPKADYNLPYAIVVAVEHAKAKWYWSYAIIPVPFIDTNTFANLCEA